VKQIKDIKYKNAYFLERSENDLYNIYSGYEPLLENYEIIFLDRSRVNTSENKEPAHAICTMTRNN